MIETKFAPLEGWEPLQDLLERSPLYHLRIAGRVAHPFEARDAWHELPAGKTRQDVLALGCWQADRLVGYCEVLRGHPTSAHAYLGLLLVAEAQQGQGLGRRLWQHTLAGTAQWSEIHTLRLAVLESNSVALEFWRHLGFVETGERKPYQGSLAILMERPMSY